MVVLITALLSNCPGPLDDARTFPLGRSTAFAASPTGLVLREDAGAVGPEAPPALSATYESRVFDLGVPSALRGVRLVTPFPAGRPLPANGVRETSGSGAADMTGNTLLLPLEESVTFTVADQSGVGAVGTFDGGITFGVPGVARGGASFDGGCLVFADAPALNPTSTLTLAAWVRPRGLDGVEPHGLFSKRADYLVQSQFTFFIWQGDRLWVDLDTEDDRFGGTRALQNDRWAHVALVYDGRLDAGVRARVFVDGTLDVVAPETSSSLAPQPVPLVVGCLPNPAGGLNQSFEGDLDEVAMWSRALSDGEVSDLYARGAARHRVEARRCATPDCAGAGAFTPAAPEGQVTLPAARYVQYRVEGAAPSSALPWASVSEVRLELSCVSDGGAPPDAGGSDGGAAADAGATGDAGVGDDAGTADGGTLADAGTPSERDAGVDGGLGPGGGATSPGSYLVGCSSVASPLPALLVLLGAALTRMRRRPR